MTLAKRRPDGRLHVPHSRSKDESGKSTLALVELQSNVTPERQDCSHWLSRKVT